MPQSDSSGKVPYKTGKIPYELKNQKEWDPDKNKPEYQSGDESKESYHDEDEDEGFVHTSYSWTLGIRMPLASSFYGFLPLLLAILGVVLTSMLGQRFSSSGYALSFIHLPNQHLSQHLATDPGKNKPEYQSDEESKESYNDDDDDEDFIPIPYVSGGRTLLRKVERNSAERCVRL